MTGHETITESAKHIEKLKELANGIQTAMLTSTHDDGSMRSRPMMLQQIDNEGCLWFFTAKNGQKIEAMLHHPDVNVSFSHPGREKFVSISGQASLVDDRAKIAELWTAAAKPWFPEGIYDPNLILLRVDMTGAEYWDIKSGLLGLVTGYIKATVTGQPVHRTGLGPISDSQKISGTELHH